MKYPEDSEDRSKSAPNLNFKNRRSEIKHNCPERQHFDEERGRCVDND